MLTIYCEVCSQPIGLFDPGEISNPILPSMFKSLDEARFVQPPFFLAASLEKIGGTGMEAWQLIRCPLCSSFPFATGSGSGLEHPTKIRTGMSGEYFEIPIDQESTAETPAPLKCSCGKEYKNSDAGKRWYKKHIESCNGRES